MDLVEVKKQAEKEFQEELFKEAVVKYKQKLRTKSSFWDFFPYRLLIIKKEK